MGELKDERSQREDNLWALYREGLLSDEELQAELARLPEPQLKAADDNHKPQS